MLCAAQYMDENLLLLDYVKQVVCILKTLYHIMLWLTQEILKCDKILLVLFYFWFPGVVIIQQIRCN